MNVKLKIIIVILLFVQFCFSNDQKRNVITINESKQSVFGPKQLVTDGRVWDVAFKDLNNDNSPDLVIANWFKPPTIYYNDGNGGFGHSKPLPCAADKDGIYRGHAVGINDFNKDTIPDIFFVFNTRNNLLYLSDKEAYIEKNQINTNHSDGLYISLGDVDNDNDIDAFVTNYKQPTILWINNGKGKFVEKKSDFGTGGYNPDLGDINNDGNLDLICSVKGKVVIWLNKGNGNYERSHQSIGYSKGYGRVKLADIDNDNDLDIIFANRSVGGSIWTNDGQGMFSETIKNLTKSSTMTVADIDLNGHIDVIFGKTIWLNKGNHQVTQYRELDIEGHILGLWLKDIDHDGDPDLFYSTSIKDNGLIFMKNIINTKETKK